ncbi:MAG: phenylalanyl-tRNA synthetase subunit beta [uncultured bacterium]|nr:MAG: phenylalanyl-tRNA synthetase subunit beta [uncultured bacterium]
MKVLYSQIKELVPDLKASPKEVGEALTLTGFMMDGFTEVSYKGAKDYLIGLEIRQNRADCLSVIGLAREVAAYYGLPVSLHEVRQISKGDEHLNINIEATDYIKRVLAIRMDEITNGDSPDWLKEYMSFYGLNSVNLLVDLSNYVMLLTGYPSHLIDYKKTEGQIVWSLNDKFDEMITLLGASVKLQKNTELIISDQKNILALAGIVGGAEAAINSETRSIVAEFAVYNRSVVRKNSRNLNIVTEASHRLEKELDPNGVEYAMNLLIDLILEYGGGKIASKLFEYYPKNYVSPKIEFKKNLPSKFSGIEIKEKDVLKIFKNLHFIVEEKDDLLLVIPPTYRLDISLPEDLVEEVLRIYGYNCIPADELPKLEIVSDITPKNILLAEKIRDILSTLGFDEILSWPLTKKEDNKLVNHIDWNTVSTQNSVNDIYPNLRQSMVTGLLNQLNEYFKKNVDFINIFEIGKIFGEKDGEYIECESLGIMMTSNKESIGVLKDRSESLLRLIGLSDIKYSEAKNKPEIANPNSCWEIYTGKQRIGILYKLTPQEIKANIYVSEINLNRVTKLLSEEKNNPVVEITQKLIALDVNIELKNSESIFEYLEKLKKKIDKNHLWSVDVVDKYPLEKSTRYTLRVTYEELSDQEAKKIHLEIFNL